MAAVSIPGGGGIAGGGIPRRYDVALGGRLFRYTETETAGIDVRYPTLILDT
jgi:hypothetical protein